MSCYSYSYYPTCLGVHIQRSLNAHREVFTILNESVADIEYNELSPVDETWTRTCWPSSVSTWLWSHRHLLSTPRTPIAVSITSDLSLSGVKFSFPDRNRRSFARDYCGGNYFRGRCCPCSVRRQCDALLSSTKSNATLDPVVVTLSKDHPWWRGCDQEHDRWRWIE